MSSHYRDLSVRYLGEPFLSGHAWLAKSDSRWVSVAILTGVGRDLRYEIQITAISGTYMVRNKPWHVDNPVSPARRHRSRDVLTGSWRCLPQPGYLGGRRRRRSSRPSTTHRGRRPPTSTADCRPIYSSVRLSLLRSLPLSWSDLNSRPRWSRGSRGPRGSRGHRARSGHS